MADFDPSTGPILYSGLEYLQRWQGECRITIHPEFTIVPDGAAELPPETALLKPVADSLALIDGKIGLVWDAMASATSAGKALDNILYLSGAPGRREGTKTTIKVVVSGVPNADISGQRVLHDSTTTAFTFPTPSTIDADGSLTTKLTSETLGPIDIAISDTGWSTAPLNTDITTITAIENSQRGAFPMSDEEFRIFALTIAGSRTVSTFPGVDAAVGMIPGVSRWKVDNNRSPFLTQDLVPAWEVELIVEGGEDQDIMLALYNSLPLTVRTKGDISTTGPDAKLYRHTRPVVVDCRVFVQWVNSGSQNVLDLETRSAIKAKIEQAIVDFISPALGLGYAIDQDLVPDELYPVVNACIPQGAIKTLEISASRVGDPPIEDPTEVANKERVRVQIGNSLVEVT